MFVGYYCLGVGDRVFACGVLLLAYFGWYLIFVVGLLVWVCFGVLAVVYGLALLLICLTGLLVCFPVLIFCLLSFCDFGYELLVLIVLEF